MFRLALALVLLAQGIAGPPKLYAKAEGQAYVQTGQERPLQADGIVRLLLDLESAIGTGKVEDFRALATPAIPATAVLRFETAARGGGGTRAIVRERARRANGRSFDVVVDVLVSRQNVGRISTWQI